MTLKLKISQSVIDTLSSLDNTAVVSLLGLISENAVIIIGRHKHLPNSLENEDLQLNLPSGIDFCGISVSEDDFENPSVTKLLQEIQVTDNPILIKRESGCLKTYFYVHEQFEESSYDIFTNEELREQFLHIRLQTRLPLICELNEQCIKEAMQTLSRKIAAGTISFLFPDSKVFLISNNIDTGLSGIEGDPTISDLWIASQKDKESFGKAKNKRKSNYHLNILPVQMLIKPTRDVKNDQISDNFAPVIKHIKREFTSLKLLIKVDALSIVRYSIQALDLYGLLVDCICKYLKLMEKSLIIQLNDKLDEKLISIPESFHFYPRECNHFITIIYPNADDDTNLQTTREQYHDIFYLPKDRPYFRRMNSYQFLTPGNDLLINPHEGLGPSGVKGGEISLVKGPYAYHHYMQDKINDDGWGCAYRSLQTIISWFRLNGYTSKLVPSHREIQQCLVDISDKPPSFVGSRQWIGSTEVSFCLETLLGVNCRILSVNSGEEMTSKGGELMQHFTVHGTPIMIGGGVLAHTILGVDFNRQTGELKFLILDPHYTGGEDLNVILNKGWCGWKGPEFWVKTAFYNMCLPLRPRCL